MAQITTDREKAAYLAAFIDGEGHVGLYRVGKRQCYNRQIDFVNTDKALFDFVVRTCLDLGLPVSTRYYAAKPPNREKWYGRIAGGKPVYQRFLDLIPLQAPQKLERVRDIIKSYADPDALTAHRRKGDEIECANCGTMFYAPRSCRARFCSVACSSAHRNTRVMKICETCGASFEAQAKQPRKFCSLECSGKAQTERLSALGKKTIAGARYARMKRHIETTSSGPRSDSSC